MLIKITKILYFFACGGLLALQMKIRRFHDTTDRNLLYKIGHDTMNGFVTIVSLKYRQEPIAQSCVSVECRL